MTPGTAGRRFGRVWEVRRRTPRRANLPGAPGRPDGPHVAPRGPTRPPISSPAPNTPSPRPGAGWGATAAPEGTPGAIYLTGRVCWPAGERFPPAVRWLTADAARRANCRPSVPNGAAGGVVYLFAGRVVHTRREDWEPTRGVPMNRILGEVCAGLAVARDADAEIRLGEEFRTFT